MDGFGLLRRAKDVVVVLGDAYDETGCDKLDGVFCQFDQKTGRSPRPLGGIARGRGVVAGQ